MALMLRQSCEEVLKKNRLGSLHADIDQGSKNLMLYTRCGKPFATVHGVRFGRLHPTKPEIEYATKLLTIWCRTNKEELDEYIKLWLEKSATPDVSQNIEYKNYQIHLNCAYSADEKGRRVNVINVVSSDGVTYSFNTKGELTALTTRENPLTAWRLNLPRSVRKLALAHAEKFDQRSIAHHRCEQLRQQLNSCME
jgi:hypothetical protein